MGSGRVETEWLLSRLLGVRSDAISRAERHADDLAAIPVDVRAGAENLLHYLAVRAVDLRREQIALSSRGLSSLGRSESHVLATIDAVIARLAADLVEEGGQVPEDVPSDRYRVGPTVTGGLAALERHTTAAFGPPRPGRPTRVMVTLPSEAAVDAAVVDRFVAAGMSVARINAAHDDRDAWSAMAGHVRRAAARYGRDVRIVVDLPGPKLRTGPVISGPAVLKVRPDRDEIGRVIRPGHVVLAIDGDRRADDVVAGGRVAAGNADTPPPEVSITGGLVAAARPGDRFDIEDARGRNRSFVVIEVHTDEVVVATDRTAYLVPGTEVVLRRGAVALASGKVARVPERPGAIHLFRGDAIELVAGDAVGHGPIDGADGSPARPARIGVDVPGLIGALAPGTRVLFDDGTIETTVESVSDDRALLRVVRPDRSKLRSGKGVNVPDLDLGVGSMTVDDRAILADVAPIADLVALSYVTHPDDVAAVHAELDQLGARHVGTVLKIEHRRAFEHLPELLLAALRRPPVAVMVARGDLAVEIGYERLAEVQEELLWLSEAAHVPVIWATQVLESLAKTGAPTRAEVTDAAWAIRAECVMLNKGPYIAETIAFLDDVLGRMAEHRSKRMPLMRRLAVAVSARDRRHV